MRVLLSGCRGTGRRLTRAAFVAIVLLSAACSGQAGTAHSPSASAPPPTVSPSRAVTDPATDKLASILARGTLVLSTDPAYAPQSSTVAGAKRSATTACPPNQLTGPELEGYDADTGKLVAERLGVEPCFVTPPWSEIIAGNWADRWDVAWGSGALTTERMTRLYVTQPYYSTPHNFFVPADSTVSDAAQLAGREVGACAGCTHQAYLEGTLELPGVKLESVVANPIVVTYDAEPPGLAATADHELAAFLCGEPVGTGAIADGLALRMLPEPAYVTQKTGYLDRGSSLQQQAFAESIDRILLDLHADGTLRTLSMRHFGVDYASSAAAFGMAALDQRVE